MGHIKVFILAENIFEIKLKILPLQGISGNLLQMMLSGVADQGYVKLYVKSQTKE